MTIVLGASLPIMPVRDRYKTPLVFIWMGWDGSEWVLSPESGVFLLPGVGGLSMPPSTRFTGSSPAVNGSRYRGHRTEEREVFLPLHIYADDSSEWLTRDRAFWRTMHPGRPGTLTATHPYGQARELKLRFVDDGGHAFAEDPVAAGWATYGITMVAEQPFWQGQPVTRTWKAGVPLPFFGAGAPSFTISSGSSLANATLDNPGDEPAWPVWTITGPTTSVSVGVAGRVVEVPFALADGETLVIDTAPTAQTARDGTGAERTADLGAVEFAPVPPGERVALSLSMVGTGVVSVELTPLYHRAW